MLYNLVIFIDKRHVIITIGEIMNYIESKIENEVIINKSRFITYLMPVKDIDAVNTSLSEIKKLHYNATHHCYAYILDNQNIQKSSDDGEPAGTAGMPILKVLLTHELDQVLCVVVRYYGGIHLGKGGLIRAYSGGASEALKKASFYKEALRMRYQMTIEYSLYDQVNYYLSEHAVVIDTQFTDTVLIDFYLHDNNLDQLLDYFNHQFTVVELGDVVVKLPQQS